MTRWVVIFDVSEDSTEEWEATPGMAAACDRARQYARGMKETVRVYKLVEVAMFRGKP